MTTSANGSHGRRIVRKNLSGFPSVATLEDNMLIAHGMSDADAVVLGSLMGSLILVPIGAITAARGAKSFGNAILAAFTGFFGGFLAFLAASSVVNGMLPSHGTSDPVLWILMGLVA